MRAARAVWAIRPKAPAAAAAAAASTGAARTASAKLPARAPRGIGLLFLLGGLAIASWLVKPTTAKPAGALDPFRRRVSIIFVIGDKEGRASALAKENGFAFVQLQSGSHAGAAAAALEPLVAQGQSRFVVAGVTPTMIPSLEKDVVVADLVLDFRATTDPAADGAEGEAALKHLDRARRLAHVDTKSDLVSVLRDRNLL